MIIYSCYEEWEIKFVVGCVNFMCVKMKGVLLLKKKERKEGKNEFLRIVI